jgi:hypothetical protein
MSFAIAGTVLTVGATVYGANRANAAARAQGRAADEATAESARQFDRTRADFAPYRVTGTGALNQLASVFGLPTATGGAQFDDTQLALNQNGVPAVDANRYANDPAYRYAWDTTLAAERASPLWRNRGASTYYARATDADWNRLNESLARNLAEYRAQNPQSQPGQAGAPNLNAFFTSPGYQFRRDEGTRGIERTAAARGGAASGNALRALSEFNQNLASNEFGNYFNQLAGISGIGQTATNQTAAYGADHAATAGRNALYAGDARASGIQNTANIIGQGVNALGMGFGYFGNPFKRPVGNQLQEIPMYSLPRRI